MSQPQNRYNLRGRSGEDQPAKRSTATFVLTTDMSTSTDITPAAGTATTSSAPLPTATTTVASMPLPPSAPRHQLESFSGKGQDPGRWLIWYDRYCAYYHLCTDQQKMADFPFHLRDHAKVWFDTLPLTATFMEVREGFLNRFKRRSFDFMTVSQAPSESVQDYFLKLCQLRPSNLDEEWVKSLAVRGLKDNIRTIVMPQNPKTLDEARQMALLAEETLTLSGSNTVAACQPSPFEAKLMQQIRDLQVEIGRLKQEHEASSSQQSNHANHRYNSDRGNNHRYNADRGNRYGNRGQNRRPYRGGRDASFLSILVALMWPLLVLMIVTPVSATDTVQRLNYGVLFQPMGKVDMSDEYWLHTFELPLPKPFTVPLLTKCRLDNGTCLSVNQVLAVMNSIRMQTSVKLESTLDTIQVLVPEAKIMHRGKRSLLPFLGQLSKTLFGTATEDDVNVLKQHVKALINKSQKLGSAVEQHAEHLSSFITKTNDRMDNIINGLKQNEMAIQYVHSEINSKTQELEENYKYLLSLLTSQILKSEHLNNQFEELKLGVLDLVNGKLSPLLVPHESLQRALNDIKTIISQKYTGFHLTHRTLSHIYSNKNFLFARNNGSLFITLKLSISSFQSQLKIFKVISLPVPINDTSSHATQILNLPNYFIFSKDHQFYSSMTSEQFDSCKGDKHHTCSFKFPLKSITATSCVLSLFINNKDDTKSLCDFRFVKNALGSSLYEIDSNTLLVYRIPLLKLECQGHHKTLTGCHFCILMVPCKCSILTTEYFIPARLSKCKGNHQGFSKVHPINLILLQHFFTDPSYKNLLADTTFVKPLNVSVPTFNLYKHHMHDIMADDRANHLNLSKMAALAKQDAIAFQSLSEPLVDGLLNINTTWPTTNDIIALSSIVVAVMASIISIFSCLKIRKLAATLLILQQTKLVKSMSTDLPEFIYTHQPKLEPSFNFDINITWDHILFVLSLTNIAILCFNLWRCTLQKNHSKILLEFTSGSQCIFIPILQLPLCASYCDITLPEDVSDVCLTSSWLNNYLKFTAKGFEIVNNHNLTVVPISNKIKINVIQARRLKEILKKPYFVFIFKQHNGMLSRLDRDHVGTNR